MSVIRALQDVMSEALRSYQHSHAELSVVGPIYLGDSNQAPICEQLQLFRNRYISSYAPYLGDAFHSRLEEQMDARAPAVHFAVLIGKRVVGLLRVRCGAYEFEELSPELRVLAANTRDYAEFSRLMAQRDLRLFHIGRLLAARASLWVLETQSVRGIVALCRPELARLFQQYGLQPLLRSDVGIPQRAGGRYRLMAGTWPMILEHVSRQRPARAIGHRPEVFVVDG